MGSYILWLGSRWIMKRRWCFWYFESSSASTVSLHFWWDFCITLGSPYVATSTQVSSKYWIPLSHLSKIRQTFILPQWQYCFVVLYFTGHEILKSIFIASSKIRTLDFSLSLLFKILVRVLGNSALESLISDPRKISDWALSRFPSWRPHY